MLSGPSVRDCYSQSWFPVFRLEIASQSWFPVFRLEIASQSWFPVYRLEVASQSCAQRLQHCAQGFGVHAAFDPQPFAIRHLQLQATCGRFPCRFTSLPRFHQRKAHWLCRLLLFAPLPTKACPPHIKRVLAYAALAAKPSYALPAVLLLTDDAYPILDSVFLHPASFAAAAKAFQGWFIRRLRKPDAVSREAKP
jgi:hypothetical protein